MKHFINSTLYSFFYELKQAYLNLKQKPLFVFSVVSTMGITLGALLCVLTLAYVMLIKPLPYPEQDRLYVVEHQSLDKNSKIQLKGFDYPTLVKFYKKQTQFSQSAISYQSDEVIRSHSKQPLVNTAFVTPEWFSLLDVPMQLGRKFSADEGIHSNTPVAILSYKIWQQDFNADSKIIDKKININDVSYKIIGVVADSFVDPQLASIGFNTQLWLPWDFNPISYKKDWWGSYSSRLTFLGKINDQLSIPQTEQQISSLVCTIIQPLVNDGSPESCERFNIKINSIKKAIISDSQTTIYLLLAGVIALVIIASTNIINLFIAHTAEQQKNLAINAALGANKTQLFYRLFSQASLLMFMALTMALIISGIGFVILNQYLSEFLPLINQLNLQADIWIPLLITAIFFALIFAFIFAKLSINTLNYKKLNTFFESSGKGTGIQISTKLRSILIVSQISIACLLAFACINLMLSAVISITKPLGFDKDNLSYLSVAISKTNNEEKFNFEKEFAFINQIKTTLSALPEVDNISTAESPLSSFMLLAAIDVSSNKKYIVDTSFGDENYFKLIGQHLIAGDNFPIQSKQDRDKLLIVNEAFAKKLALSGKVIGKKLDLSGNGSNVFTVIGIINNIFQPSVKEVALQMYAPSSTLAPKFLIKFNSRQHLSKAQLIKTLNNISSLLTISQYKSLDNAFNEILLPERITLVSTISMTIISLLLAALGLYGILSYSTQMRRFEIGTRMAIGAKRSDVIKLIIKDNAKAILLGVGVSILVLLALALGFSEQLSDYLTWQLIPLFLVTLGLVSLISFAACYLPLRQYINKPAMYSLRGSE